MKTKLSILFWIIQNEVNPESWTQLESSHEL